MRLPGGTSRWEVGQSDQGIMPMMGHSGAARAGVVNLTQTCAIEWAEYGVRVQTNVTRVTPTLLESPFRIAQDLLSLDGFTVQRLGWGVNFTRNRERLGLTFAVENLTNAYYREHFQFAPARGRSFTVGLSLGAF